MKKLLALSIITLALTSGFTARAEAKDISVRKLCYITHDRVDFQTIITEKSTKKSYHSAYTVSCNKDRNNTWSCSGARIDLDALNKKKEIGFFGFGTLKGIYLKYKGSKIAILQWGFYNFVVNTASHSITGSFTGSDTTLSGSCK